MWSFRAHARAIPPPHYEVWGSTKRKRAGGGGGGVLGVRIRPCSSIENPTILEMSLIVSYDDQKTCLMYYDLVPNQPTQSIRLRCIVSNLLKRIKGRSPSGIFISTSLLSPEISTKVHFFFLLFLQNLHDLHIFIDISINNGVRALQNIPC